MIKACQRQVRVAARGVFALDFGAVLGLAAARQLDVGLLAEVLPDIEPLVVAHYAPDEED